MKRFSLTLFKTAFLAFACFPNAVFAAACCGGGGAFPSLILSDDQAQFGVGISLRTQSDLVQENGVWEKTSDLPPFESLQLEGAHLVSDRWQIGGSLPLVKRELGNQSKVQFGDLQIVSGYEILPEWDYHPLRPKGVLFVSLTVPTGGTQFDSEGKGFWQTGMGIALTKAWGNLDLAIELEGHHAFSRSDSVYGKTHQLQPGWGGSFLTGLGWSLGNWRAGTSLTWNYEDPVSSLLGDQFNRGTLKRNATATLSIHTLLGGNLNPWRAGLSYSDQTWFGSPLHTALEQSITLQIQKIWSR